MPALKKLHDRENGFTLIELLIVVLIIGVLAAIAIPVYLGIQQQGYKSAVRADVNLSVKRVQVALTEGTTITTVKANASNYTQSSVKGETVSIIASPSSNASASDFGVQGIVTKNSTPTPGPINYGYFYDSVTGKFTESEDAVVLGSSAPSIVITTGSLPNAVTNTAYSATVNATTVNPTGATQYTASGLPTGWNIDASTGTISAPASAVTSTGNQSITVTATNGSVSTSRTYTVATNSVPVVTTATAPNGVVGTAYSQQFAASGTPTPTSFGYTGNLPTGLNFTAAGLLSGTPTATGTFSFSVTATNTAGTSAAQAYTVVVNSKPAITTASIPGAVQSSSGYSQFVASTGTPSATYTATGLPAGMSINSSTGEISGSAGTTATTYNVSVTATNTAGSDSKNLNLIVSPNILTNASFETGDGASWLFNPSGPAVNGTLTCPAPVGTVTPHQGTKQLLFYSGNTGEYKTFLQDTPITVTAGKTYGAGMWVNGCSQAGQAGNLYFSEYDAGGNITVMKVVPYTSTGGWTYVGTTVTAPSNGTGLRIQYVTTNNYGNVIFDDANVGVIQ